MIDTKKIARVVVNKIAVNEDATAEVKALCDAHAANAVERLAENVTLGS